VVKRFLSTPGWESGGEKLRSTYDNVKQVLVTATQLMATFRLGTLANVRFGPKANIWKLMYCCGAGTALLLQSSGRTKLNVRFRPKADIGCRADPG